MAIYIFAGLMLIMVILLLILLQNVNDFNEMLEEELEDALGKEYKVSEDILNICRSCGECYEKIKVADEELINELTKKIVELQKS